MMKRAGIRQAGRGKRWELLPISLFLLALLVLFGTPEVARAGSPDRPDILLVVADDMDLDHAGFRNPAAYTPTLDRIKDRGVYFPNGWMTPRCAPSLASLLTGLHPHEHGRYYNRDVAGSKRELDLNLSVARELQNHGYHNYAGGKWWFGPIRDAGFEAGNTNRDEFAREGQRELFTWLDSIPSDENFFIWWAPLLPHTPHNPPQEYLDRIDETKILVPPTIAPEDLEEFLTKETLQLATTAWFDDALTRLLSRLASRNRHHNLLIVFCIDNGWSNGRVSKGSPYEKGWQSPFLLFNPGVIPEGETRSQVVSIVDLFPTILDYAGIPLPERSDGRSLRTLVEDPEADWREEMISVAYPAFAANEIWHEDAYAISVRDEEWKLIVYIKDVAQSRNGSLKIWHILTDFPERVSRDQELYFLPDDPFEEVNLIDREEHRERRDRMRQSVKQWWLERGGDVPPLPKPLTDESSGWLESGEGALSQPSED